MTHTGLTVQPFLQPELPEMPKKTASEEFAVEWTQRFLDLLAEADNATRRQKKSLARLMRAGYSSAYHGLNKTWDSNSDLPTRHFFHSLNLADLLGEIALFCDPSISVISTIEAEFAKERTKD